MCRQASQANSEHAPNNQPATAAADAVPQPAQQMAAEQAKAPAQETAAAQGNAAQQQKGGEGQQAAKAGQPAKAKSAEGKLFMIIGYRSRNSMALSHQEMCFVRQETRYELTANWVLYCLHMLGGMHVRLQEFEIKRAVRNWGQPTCQCATNCV